MNSNRLLYWSLTVAMAGFLFGFDTVAISGADQALQELWPKGDLFHGFVIMASALWGTVVGSLFGRYPTDSWGRKNTLIVIGLLYMVSAVGSAMCSDPYLFSFFRFLGGLGVGASTIAAPAYISEIAPSNDRGKLVATYQFNIVLGIMIAFISNYLLRDFGSQPWRWMLGVEAIPALLYSVMVFMIPQSPRWLVTYRNNTKEAKSILLDLGYTSESADKEIELIASSSKIVGTESVFDKTYRFPLILAFLIAFFNQFSGINAFLYYAPRIFEEAGLGESSALLSSVGIGLTNLIFTIMGMLLIDKAGRKQLMYIGSVGYIVSLVFVAYAFASKIQGMAVPISLFVFIAAHAIGQGAVIWVYISEIFPNHIRAQGQTVGTGTHWVLAAIIPSLVPFLFSSVGTAPVFGFFAFMMCLQLLFVYKMMPETKGKSLEELQIELRT